MKNYINYHCHTQYSNISTPDSTISNAQRVGRAIELKQGVVSSVEHGTTGRFIEVVELAKINNIKPLIGSEVYFVKNRFEKDKTNSHIILLAKNEIGRKSINRILSEANVTGFYYKPRIDLELLLSLPKDSIWVTTACLGGIWKYDNYLELIEKIYSHFGNNFFLEVQNHHVSEQIELNKKILDISNRLGIKIIAGMDSHMISSSQSNERDNYLLSRGIQYPEEKNWFLDYPSYNDAYARFVEQDVLNKYQIEECLENTNIFNEVEPYDSPIFDNSIIKLPTLYPNKTQEEKNNILRELIYSQWNIEKNNVPQTEWAHYEKEIEKELNVVFTTNMSDYFLIDYAIIKRGKEMGGSITLTGRGSAPSFYLSKLLGFTTIDRISASVRLFPERFISAERLLETKSLPDIDFNLGTPEIFAKAQEEILGQGHSYQMIAFGTVKSSGAWKIYARVAGVDFETANLISLQIQSYEKDLLHASEEDKDTINILDYIDEKFHDIYLESKKYLGLVNTLTSHPCAYLLYTQGDIREEFGLIKIKTGNVEHICVACDGLFAESYKLLKNDLLKVSVVDLIYRTYNLIGIKPHPLPELIKICNGDEKVWNIYKNAWTMGINQVEQHGSSGRVAKYSPKNISEISAFVAAIRPGFQSNYKQFEAREKFEYGIPSLDRLIQTNEFPQSYLLYQENAMQVLAYAGIPISNTYEIIKNIAKKRVDKVLKYKEQFLLGMCNRLINEEGSSQEEANSIAEMTWKIIEDSSRYSFNASHSYSVAGDSLYGAYLKAYYPLEFYVTFLRMMEEDGDKDRLSSARREAEKAFHIKFPSFKFGQDNRSIVADKNNNAITSSIKTIKGFGNNIGEDLYNLSLEFTGNDFVDLLIFAEETGRLSSKWISLIKINYFDKFGNNKKLLSIFQEFESGKNGYNRSLSQKSKDKRTIALHEIFNNTSNERLPFQEQVLAEQEILGYITTQYPEISKKYIYVMEVDTKYAPRIQAYCLNNGVQSSLKVYKRNFENLPFKSGDILYCHSFSKKPSLRFENGSYIENPDGEPTWWIENYGIVTDFDGIVKEK